MIETNASPFSLGRKAMRAKRYFTDDILTTTYDVIIIGSGLSSLSTAGFLAREGKKVLVLEKHKELGGFLHSYVRKAGEVKFHWDIGLHYVGNGKNKNANAHQVFDYLTDGGITWADMGAVYDVAYFGSDKYEFHAGMAQQLESLISYFPTEEKGIRDYYQLVDKIGVYSVMYFSEKTMPLWLSQTGGYFLKRNFNKYAQVTTQQVISSYTQNKKLQSVLAAQCGNYGLPPSRSAYMIQGIITDHYMNGGSYPVGGSSMLVEQLVAAIEQHGGQVAANCGVDSILVDKGVANGVTLENGQRLMAKYVVAGIGAKNTINKLLQDEVPKNKSLSQLRTKVNALAPSLAHICLSIGLEGSVSALDLPRSNIWEYDSYDIDACLSTQASLNDLPQLRYYSFPAAKDPQASATHASIQVIMPIAYDLFKQWENTKWQQRGEAYEQWKEAMTAQVLEKVYERLPKVKGKVIFTDLSSPLSTRHFNQYDSGEMYGLAHTPERFALNELRITTPVKNLFLTGQDVMCVGIGATISSGMLTASIILKRNLLNRVHAYQKAKNEAVSDESAKNIFLKMADRLIKLRQIFIKN